MSKINLIELLAKNPVEETDIDAFSGGPDNMNREILRLAIIAELDAASFYEQMARKTTDERIIKVLLKVAKEEKTHVGEFEALLKLFDPEHAEELRIGSDEVSDELYDIAKFGL